MHFCSLILWPHYPPRKIESQISPSHKNQVLTHLLFDNFVLIQALQCILLQFSEIVHKNTCCNHQQKVTLIQCNLFSYLTQMPSHFQHLMVNEDTKSIQIIVNDIPKMSHQWSKLLNSKEDILIHQWSLMPLSN